MTTSARPEATWAPGVARSPPAGRWSSSAQWHEHVMSTPEERAADVVARIDAADRPEVWIERVPVDDLAGAVAAVDARVAAGNELPLAGRTFAVKDNIDIAGLPTTAGCPAFASVPTVTAPAVQALLDAGAVLVGKTNLDQFATGLVG